MGGLPWGTVSGRGNGKGANLLEDGIEHGHVVGLALVGVGEEEVGLVGEELGNGDLLHPQDEVRLAQVCDHLGSGLTR